MPSSKTVPLPGSEKQPLPNAHVIAPSPPDERLEVTIRLRPKNPLPGKTSMLEPSADAAPVLTRKAYNARYGADPKDIERIRRFATANHLIVVHASAARRSVMLSGMVVDFNKAFHVDLRTYEYPGGTYRGRVGPIRVPSELAPIVEGVFGLDNRPVARRHIRVAKSTGRQADGAQAFNPPQVATLYNYPTGVDGTGQTVGIIELGGGYRPQDLQSYLQGLGLKAPTVLPVSVDGATNSPSGDPGGDDGEVGLDIEVVAALAPGAKIVVYFAPNDRTSKGFLDAITKAVHDDVNDPSVISISWGGPEAGPGDAFQTQFDQVLQAAALLGITVCIAAGDDGAADMGPKVWDGLAHVDFPAASPFALACGGTRLIASSGSISAESVWNQHAADTSADAGPDGSFGAGGGGVSGAFPLPAYQNAAKVPPSLNPSGYKGRGVPDVSGDADPASGYNVLVDGSSFVVGGTSAVAPLWAALVALLNQKLGGRVGFLNPKLYAIPATAGALRDVTVGDNMVTYQTHKNVGYSAGPGWDACSGLGSPNGGVLAQQLTVSTPGGQSSAKVARSHKPSRGRKAARRKRAAHR